MIKLILAFVVVFVMFFFGIKAVRSMTGKQALELTKIVGCSILCSVMTIAVLVGIVILF